MSQKLADKTAVVTGSTDGIGKTIAHTLAQQGASVVVNGRDNKKGEAVAETLSELSGSATFVSADLTVYDQVQELMRAAADKYGGIDILIANGAAEAGPTPKFFEQMDPEDFLEWSKVGYASRMYAIHAALEYLKHSQGTVINITADAGKVPTPAEVGPGGAAAALMMATRVLAKELARYRITVNAVSLSIIEDTPAQDSLMGDAESTKVFEEASEQQSFNVTPRDIAEAVLYFVGRDVSPPVTGQVLSINGGISFPG
jgi:3-oxoacyl-[acyl-carrier protein] reductase